MNNRPENPIGIFDSGIGGLTVAHAIRTLMPHEHMVYFGDTAHLPYGDKSEAAIQAYSVKIANVLLQKGCKVIVIACHSASSAAYELLKEYVRHEAIVVNVIDPMVDFVVRHFPSGQIGLIGTKRTVQSDVYTKKFRHSDKKIVLKALATPLLAPMIEEGFFNNQISREIVAQYLADPHLGALDALILGCTHYPLIKKEIEAYYHGQTQVLDSSVVAAQSLHSALAEKGLLNNVPKPESHFFVSDYTESFEASTRLFFGENVRLESHRLWN
ncbi:MAG TPA: glutamate racemase [Cyclobacteriaceae bacterium]|nr:glutamate racemase [Cyclobacteriaceae bacterium]